MQTTTPPTTIDAYITGYPPEVRERLELVRATIQEAAPTATETIKYGMPTFVLNGNLVYFAAFKHHIGIYSFPSAHQAFAEQLAGYKRGKGSVQLPHDAPLPLALIGKMVRFRVQENLAKPVKKK